MGSCHYPKRIPPSKMPPVNAGCGWRLRHAAPRSQAVPPSSSAISSPSAFSACRESSGAAPMSDYRWQPSADYLDNANVTRLAKAHGIDGIAELRARAVADVAWYWGAVLDDLGITFATPYSAVLDISRGIERSDWFIGAELNVVDCCVRRWRDSDPDRIAGGHEAG